MRIEVAGDESINSQARTYAEYRLFAALSQAVDTRRVRRASLVLRRARAKEHGASVLCTVTVELHTGETSSLRASGEHPYAAINRAVERLRRRPRPLPHDSPPGAVVAAEGEDLLQSQQRR